MLLNPNSLYKLTVSYNQKLTEQLYFFCTKFKEGGRSGYSGYWGYALKDYDEFIDDYINASLYLGGVKVINSFIANFVVKKVKKIGVAELPPFIFLELSDSVYLTHQNEAVRFICKKIHILEG